MSYTVTPYAALMLDELEDYELVIAELSTHIEGGLPSGAAMHNRAVARWEIGEYEQALMDFDLAAAQLPQDHMPLQMKGVMLQKLGRLKEGLQAMDLAMAIAPNEVRLVRTRAYARLEAGLLREALEDLDHAVQLEPSFQCTRDERDKLARQLGCLGPHPDAA
jgi:tetratricopeptide (TPR) repeat protein